MNPWAILAGVAAVATVYVVIPVVSSTYARFRRPRRLRCPETGTEAEVSVDARHAALTAALTHPPQLRVAGCSFWPERHACHEGCLAVEAGDVEPAGSSPA